MFGIEDPQIWFGYLMAIGLAILCAVYGLLKWNNNGDSDGQ